MPVNVGAIAEQAVRSRYNPYRGQNPDLLRIQAQGQANQLRASNWNVVGKALGQIAQIAISQGKAKMAQDSLKVSETDNSKAAIETRQAIKAARSAGIDNVPKDNAAIKTQLQNNVQEAIDAKLEVPRSDKVEFRAAKKELRAARKELRQFKQGIYNIETASGGAFKTKEEGQLFLESYNTFKKNGLKDIRGLMENMQGGKYDPFYNADEEVVMYSLQQGRHGQLVPKEGGGANMVFTAKVPVRDEYGRLTYNKDGEIKLQDKTVSYDASLFNGQGTVFNQIQPPVTAGTIMSRFKEEAPAAWKAYSNENAPKIEPGSIAYDQLISAFKQEAATDPNFVKSFQRALTLESGQEVKIDTSGDGKITADEIFAAVEPTINIGKKSQQEIDIERGVRQARTQLAKERALGITRTNEPKLSEREKKELAALNTAKADVADLFNGNTAPLLKYKYNGKQITNVNLIDKTVDKTVKEPRTILGINVGDRETTVQEVVPGDKILRLDYVSGISDGETQIETKEFDLSNKNTREKVFTELFGTNAREIMKYVNEQQFSFGGNTTADLRKKYGYGQ